MVELARVGSRRLPGNELVMLVQLLVQLDICLITHHGDESVVEMMKMITLSLTVLESPVDKTIKKIKQELNLFYCLKY